MLRQMIDNSQLKASGVVAFYPARADGDDILVYSAELDDDVDLGQAEPIATFYGLRQQTDREHDETHFCLSDFVSPTRDYIGLFACTAGLGAEELARHYEKDELDDYKSIMVKALADRLAEAFAEALHSTVRRSLWGYSPDEALQTDDLLRVKYKGIRPAPGYPTQPEHTEKRTLWRLCQAEKLTGMSLTESLAMEPAASVSGMYFAHPQSQYFAVGKIDRDQVADYAGRKGMPLDEAQRWLAPILGYEP